MIQKIINWRNWWSLTIFSEIAFEFIRFHIRRIPTRKSLNSFSFSSFSLTQKTPEKFMLLPLQRKFDECKHKLVDWLIRKCALPLFWKLCVQTLLWSFTKRLYDGTHLLKVHTIVHVLLGICRFLTENLFFRKALIEWCGFMINMMLFLNLLYL